MSNNFEIKGEIHEIGKEQVFSEKFKKRDLILRIQDNNYEQHIKFQLINDRCDLLDKYKVGQDVIVHFNLKGRGYEKNNETVYYTNLECWRIQKAEDDTTAAAPTKPAKSLKKQSVQTLSIDDDLPF